MAEHYENEMETTVTNTVKQENQPVDVPTALSWMDRAAELYKKHGMKGVLMALLVLFVTCVGVSLVVITAKFVINPDKVFQQYYEWQEKKEQLESERHKELIEKRMANTPKIQLECDKLLYKTNAQRVLFMELHNNTNNIAGLPFYFADASCESMNDYAQPIAPYCQQAKLSLMPFASHLFDKGEWCGSLSDLKEIDKAFYYKMMASGADHMAAVIVEGLDTSVGMLFLTFGEEDEHNCESAILAAKNTAVRIAVLVEVEKESNLPKKK